MTDASRWTTADSLAHALSRDGGEGVGSLRPVCYSKCVFSSDRIWGRNTSYWRSARVRRDSGSSRDRMRNYRKAGGIVYPVPGARAQVNPSTGQALASWLRWPQTRWRAPGRRRTQPPHWPDRRSLSKATLRATSGQEQPSKLATSALAAGNDGPHCRTITYARNPCCSMFLWGGRTR